MSKPEIKLYYKKATAEAIGRKHGITQKQLDRELDALPKKIRKLRAIPKIRKKEDAYRNLVENEEIAQQVEDVIADLKGPCENLVVLGIGGSALGNIALQTALNPYMHNLDDKQRTGPRLFVFDNIDPPQLVSFLKWLGKKLKRTVFNVISRTGTASETMSQFMIVRKRLRKLGARRFRNQMVVTTCFNQNPLHTIAINENLPRLEIPEDVGGRFSVLSPVGLFSAAMCGVKINLLLEGARNMHGRVLPRISRTNPAALIAAIHHHFYEKGKKISVMIPYSFALKDMADWYRQLWAESLGKARNLDGKAVHTGPTPVKALGATDQHSQLQLYLEGPNDKVCTFLEVEKFKKDLTIGKVPSYTPELKYLENGKLSTLLKNEKKATEFALLKMKRPCLTVIFPEVSPYTVGQFIYLYEVTTSFSGALFGINPYNQPGVELVKEATIALMGKAGNYKDGYKYGQFAEDIRGKTNIDKKFLV